MKINATGPAACLLLAGCFVTPPPLEAPPDRPAARPARREPVTRTIGSSLEGRAIRAHTFGDGSDTVLIIASIHGSEGAGTPLVERLMDHLTRHPAVLAGRRVAIIPRANPDGLAKGERHNRRGVDLNRNFPALNRRERGRSGTSGLSEPESRALATLIGEIRPTRIVSIHQPLSCVDYDGPALALARRMSAACGLPVKKLGARPGSLGAYAGEDLRIPIITLELPGKASSQDAATLWRLYGGALLAAIRGA